MASRLVDSGERECEEWSQGEEERTKGLQGHPEKGSDTECRESQK